ncbi:Rod shape-determining protein MreC [hydrothermal vent metagenome]|uniref:Cell shape-determining protein MreC n=1 Tax=hydrothermal vent metagenome TaxID=652676 RepID=A0A3B1E4W0_9ZZZZ
MFKNFPKNLIYLLLIFLPFYFFFIREHSFSGFRFKLIQIIEGPIQLISSPLIEIKKMLFYQRTFQEYKRLSKENKLLRARFVGMKEVVRENARLEKLLAFKRNLIYSSVAASVIGREPSRWNASIVIDRGENDGIKQGMPVVNALGVVGKVGEVSPNKSKVILLTDPQFSVAALAQRTRESGLVSGTLQGICRMRYVQENAQVSIGDKVITSKLSSSFPEGLIVGEIVDIYESPRGPSVECVIKPAVSFSQLEEVLVILK